MAGKIILLVFFIIGCASASKTGNCVNGNCDNGRGTFVFSAGGPDIEYTGEWKHGMRQGRGVSRYANGDRYEGEWKNDMKDGQGDYSFSKGDKYQGQWKDGKRQGRGVYTWRSGDRFEGEWLNDEKHGEGALYSSEGTLLKKGIWNNDRYIGGKQIK